jgi:4-amino-4-deoxy-L-arabinose transferase-like glycosyltransferase
VDETVIQPPLPSRPRRLRPYDSPATATSEGELLSLDAFLEGDGSREPRAASRLGGIVFISGIALIAWGISLMRSGQQFLWLPTDLRSLMSSYIVDNQAVLVGGGVMAAGALLTGMACRRPLPDRLAGLTISGLRLRFDPMAVISLLLASICYGLLIVDLVAGRYTHGDIGLFFASLFLVAIAVHRLNTPSDAIPLPFALIDLPAALGLALLTFIVNSIDLTHWRFSSIGDEGAFFAAAQDIMHGGPWNFFDLTWVYGTHPALDSAIVALGLRVFSDDIVGWRLSEIILLAVSTVLMYLLTTLLLGRMPAIVAAVVLGSNHYVMAFSRIGYNNSHVILYSTFAILMLVLAWRSRRAIFVYATGAAVGFCLYTFFTATFAGPIIALLLLIPFVRRPSREQVGAGALMLCGFAMVVAPALLATTLDDFLKVAVDNSYPSLAASDPLLAMRIGLIDSAVVFWHNYQWRHHFVGGPLVDALTGVLLVVGLGIALFRINKRVERLAIIWFAGGLVLITLTDFGPYAHLTRLLFIIPAAALLVAVAVRKIDYVLRKSLRIPAQAARWLLPGLILIIPLINLSQFHIDSPAHLSTNWIIIMVKGMQEHPDWKVVQVGRDEGVTAAYLNPFWIIYPWLRSRYDYVSYTSLQPAYPVNLGEHPPIYFVIDEHEAILEAVTAKLSRAYTRTMETDPPGIGKVWWFTPIIAADGP